MRIFSYHLFKHIQRFYWKENIVLRKQRKKSSQIIRLFSYFSNEMTNFLEKDYEYLQTFLSTNITDQKLVESLMKSSPMQQILIIINLLRTGEKNGTISSCMMNRMIFSSDFKSKNSSLVSPLPNQDKWLRSRKSASSSLFEFIQYACCCQRRNRVTTDAT